MSQCVSFTSQVRWMRADQRLTLREVQAREFATYRATICWGGENPVALTVSQLMQLQWDINLRTNLRIWPTVAPNIACLAKEHDNAYDETDFVSRFPSNSGKSPTDTRAVRNTFEALAQCGLAYRSNSDRFLLTTLGECVLSFVGVSGSHSFANNGNIRLVGQLLIRGLSVVLEFRAIWLLFRLSDNCLSNEELNRAMGRIQTLEDVVSAAGDVLRSRDLADPTIIGPRIYHDERFATDPSEQRKAMNPQFLLAGGGGIILAFDDSSEFRKLPTWASRMIDRELATKPFDFHASTDATDVLRISAKANAPRSLRDGS